MFVSGNRWSEGSAPGLRRDSSSDAAVPPWPRQDPRPLRESESSPLLLRASTSAVSFRRFSRIVSEMSYQPNMNEKRRFQKANGFADNRRDHLSRQGREASPGEAEREIPQAVGPGARSEPGPSVVLPRRAHLWDRCWGCRHPRQGRPGSKWHRACHCRWHRTVLSKLLQVSARNGSESPGCPGGGDGTRQAPGKPQRASSGLRAAQCPAGLPGRLGAGHSCPRTCVAPAPQTTAAGLAPLRKLPRLRGAVRPGACEMQTLSEASRFVPRGEPGGPRQQRSFGFGEQARA